MKKFRHKRIWTTKDNVDIPIRKMSDSHLVNAYNMLFRNGMSREISLEFGWLEDEIDRRRIGRNKLSPYIKALRCDRILDAEIWASCQWDW